MTYWEIYYGKCKEKPKGSPDCHAYCRLCNGLNWKPLGPKTYDEMLKFFLELDNSKNM
jgi:hypothetical protein